MEGANIEVPHLLTISGPVQSADFQALGKTIGHPVDAIFGGDALSVLALTILPGSQTFVLAPSGSVKVNGVDLRNKGQLPNAEEGLLGIGFLSHFNLILDMGAKTLILPPAGSKSTPDVDRVPFRGVASGRATMNPGKAGFIRLARRPAA